jgi:putative membrane protein
MKNSSLGYFSTGVLAMCASALMLTSTGMAAEKDTLDAADVKFVKHEAANGMAVVKIATLGSSKAEHKDVKALAGMLVTDHTAVNAELKELAKTKGVELSAVIDPKHAEEFQKLEKADAKNFDKEFLAAVASGHTKCVKSFEAASKDAKDSDVKAFAAKVLPTLKAHLEKVKELQPK